MSDTTQTSGQYGAGEDEYTPTGTDQVAENLAALDDDEAELRAASLRAGLEDYELDEEDAALLSGEYGDEDTRVPSSWTRFWPSSAGPTWASPRWSTASLAAARPLWKTPPALPATA